MLSRTTLGTSAWGVLAGVSAALMACSSGTGEAATDSGTGSQIATDPFDESDSPGSTGTDPETDTGTDTGSDAECEAEPVFVTRGFEVWAEVDLSNHEQGRYFVRERLTVAPQAAGSVVSFFGEQLESLAANVPFTYDGHRATFCVPAYQAGDRVEVEVSFTVLAENQVTYYNVIPFGLRQWQDSSGRFVIGPFNEPYYAPYWLLVPQAPGSVDSLRDVSPVVQRTELEVIAPDESFVVLGPGGLGQRDGVRHRFVLDYPMPVYGISFAASADYEVFQVGQTQAGVQVVAAVLPGSKAAAQAVLSPVPAALDYMAQAVGPYAFGDTLAFVEIPGFGGGMEHVGAIWIGSDVFSLGLTGQEVAIHEAVHHYWGNAVRFTDWPHFWLAEGFDEWSTHFNALSVILDSQDMKAHKLDYRIEAAAITSPLYPGMPEPGPLRFDDNDDMMDHFVSDLQLYYIYGAAFLEMVNQRLVRHYDTDLESLLARWYDEHLFTSATTEDFRAFLQEETAEVDTWAALFDDWVYQTPCPTLRAESYAWDGSTATFVLRRTAGKDQDLSELEVAFDLGDEVQVVPAPLPKGQAQVSVSASLPVEPSATAIDPDQLYIFELSVQGSWTGPSLGLALE